MKSYLKSSLLALGALGMLVPLSSTASMHTKEKPLADYVGSLPSGPNINENDIRAAQKMWGDAVVKIGEANNSKKVAKKAAKAAYAFDLGPIMFKPTLTSGETTFRPDLEGTLSYFVSGNSKYEGDKGFALKPWSKVRFDNHKIKIFGNIAIAMGHYFFTDKATGEETKVEYTKGYVKTKEGRVLLFLQDSSLPYSPPTNIAQK